MIENLQAAAESWVADLELERSGPVRRILKRHIVNPFANYCPAVIQRAFFHVTRSELASASWSDPGGWRSMVISYEDCPPRLADKLLVRLGTMPMALRNRRRLAARIIARLIDATDHEPVEVLCLGAGPGHIICDALRECRRKAHATLVDLSSEAFDYGRRLAAEAAACHEVRFVQGDVREVSRMLDRPPDVVKMLGICEYLSDDRVIDITRTVAEVMPAGSFIVLNSLTKAHGTNRFFRRVMRLRMVHREPDEVRALVAAAGFTDFVTLAEPLGVYHVIIGRKAQAG
jgi:SAM-dependent methyltransferase